MIRNEPLVYSTTDKNVIVDYDYENKTFDRSLLNHSLLINHQDLINKFIQIIEAEILREMAIIVDDNKYRKYSLYTTLFLLFIIFIFSIVGGATELYYFFYIAMGIFFIKTTIVTLINYFYKNPRFNDAFITIKNNCKKIIDEYNKEFKNKGLVCGLNYAAVVNEKKKVTFYKKIKLYLLFFQLKHDVEEDIEDFELNYFQMIS